MATNTENLIHLGEKAVDREGDLVVTAHALPDYNGDAVVTVSVGGYPAVVLEQCGEGGKDAAWVVLDQYTSAGRQAWAELLYELGEVDDEAHDLWVAAIGTSAEREAFDRLSELSTGQVLVAALVDWALELVNQ